MNFVCVSYLDVKKYFRVSDEYVEKLIKKGSSFPRAGQLVKFLFEDIPQHCAITLIYICMPFSDEIRLQKGGTRDNLFAQCFPVNQCKKNLQIQTMRLITKT